MLLPNKQNQKDPVSCKLRDIVRRGGSSLLCTLMISLNLSPVIAQCPSATGPVSPVTINSEPSIPDSRQLQNGSGTVVNTGTPGKVAIDLVGATSLAAMVVGTFSAGGVFTPTQNSFTNVTNAQEIDLPATSSIPVGSIVALAIGGTQGTVNVVTDAGTGDEHIAYQGSNNGSITLNNNDVVYLLNMGSAQWLVTNFVAGLLTVCQGGTGATTAAGARMNLGAAASGANSDITSLLGLTTPLSVSQGGTGFPGGFSKGDLLVATDSTTLSRLPAGADGQGLIADSTTATGLRWSSISGESAGDLLVANSKGFATPVHIGADGALFRVNLANDPPVEWSSPVAVSSGVADAGKIPMLDSSGKLDPSVTVGTLGSPGTVYHVSDDGTTLQFSGYAIPGNYFGSGTTDATISAVTTLGDGTDNGDFVIGQYNNLTVNSGGALTAAARKQGMIIYVKGDLVVHSGGMIHMNGRGASGTPSSSTIVYRYAYSSSPFSGENQNQFSGYAAFGASQPGADGAASAAIGTAGLVGGSFSNATGGGGSGGSTAYSGAMGAAGTAWCGGAGGGGAGGSATGGTVIPAVPTSGSANGGAGGAGGVGQTTSTHGGGGGGGGGAGAPGGNGGGGGNSTSSGGGGGGGGGEGNSGGSGGNGGSSYTTFQGAGGGGGGGGLVSGGSGGLVGNRTGANGGAHGGAGGGPGGGSGGVFSNGASGTIVANSGGGGGTLIIIVRGNVTVEAGGIISADGGAGGAGGQGGSGNTHTGGNGGGGGGGAGGGRVAVLYAGTAAVSSGTIHANGGAGGAAGLAGTGATAGSVGTAGGAGGAGDVTVTKILGQI